jgi:cyanophycinase
MLSGYVIDTHFSERGREGRLIRLLQDTRNRTSIGTTKGFGVDEDTAVVVTNLFTRPTGRVVGTTGGVLFADVTNLVYYPSSTTDFERVSTTFLTHGDVIDLTNGAVTFASWKSSLAGNENFNNAVPSNDILSFKANGVWRSTAKRLFDNKIDNMIINDSREKKPEFRVTFDKTSGIGYGGYLPSDSNVFVVSYKDLRVDIRGFD